MQTNRQIGGQRRTLTLVLVALAGILVLTAVGIAVKLVFHPSRVNAEKDQYLPLLNEVGESVSSIQRSLASPAPLTDIDRLKKSPTEETSEAEMPVLDVSDNRSLVLRGIAVESGKRVAFINDYVVGIDQEIAGYRVVSIRKDSVVFRDQEGNRKEVSIYERLKKYEDAVE